MRLLLFVVSVALSFMPSIRDYPEEEENLNQHFSRKLKADVFIDDRNLGGLPGLGDNL